MVADRDNADLVYTTGMDPEVQCTFRRPLVYPRALSCPNADCQLVFTVLTLDMHSQTFSGLEQSFLQFCFALSAPSRSVSRDTRDAAAWSSQSEHGNRSSKANIFLLITLLKAFVAMISNSRERNLHPSKKKVLNRHAVNGI